MNSRRKWQAHRASFKNARRELANLTEQVDKLREELKSAPQESLEVIQRLKKEKEGLLGKREEALNEARARMAKLRAELENSLALQKDISKMDSCPVCLQRVGETHKRDIHEREDRKVESCRKRISDEELVEKKEKSEYLKLKQEVEQITGSLYALELFQVKSRNVNEKEKRLKELLGLKENAKKEIGQINARKLELQEELKRFEGVEKLCEQEKKQLDSLSAEERRLTMELTRIEAEHKGLKREIESMEQEIEAKMLTKKNLEQAKKLQHWLESFFMNLMIVMEKHVMGCVHGEFNEVFQQWFKMLIEDEVFNVRLDDEFTPVVEQNGYEIEIENLSGGEKASCALAYRLALNKVVNEFISTIKTRNLIILDEPTDGFSTEQLDRVRDVLAQLKLPQVIIVSHESKIESFVDNLIRVRKEEHVSVLD
jgi:exonuclease SbcC